MSHYLLNEEIGIRPLQSSHHNRNFLIFPYADGWEIYLNPAHQRESYFGRDIHPYEFLFLKNNKNNTHLEEHVRHYTEIFLS